MCGNKFYQLSTCCTKDQRVEPFTFNHRRLPLPFLALQLACAEASRWRLDERLQERWLFIS